MDVIVERCAGLDVHRDEVVATVRVPGSGRRQWEKQTQTFKATLAGLAELALWLAEAGVTLVGMEATGVYWKTVFQALEDRFECWLLNAHHLRNVPGRKTDVKDSEWICQLVQHGLVRPSFVPPVEIRRLRDLTRLRRRRPTSARARSSGSRKSSRTPGSNSRASPRTRTRSPPARCSKRCSRASRIPNNSPSCPRARCARRSRSSRSAREPLQVEHHGIMVAQLLAHIDTLDIALQNLSERIEFVLIPHAEIIELLCTIPGVQTHAAQVLIAECGLNMTLFPTVGHFASWAGACPGHHQSAGRGSGRTRPGPAGSPTS